MTTTKCPASEVKIGDNMGAPACRPHIIDRIEPYSTPGIEGALAFHSGTWSIVLMPTTVVRVIT